MCCVASQRLREGAGSCVQAALTACAAKYETKSGLAHCLQGSTLQCMLQVMRPQECEAPFSQHPVQACCWAPDHQRIAVSISAWQGSWDGSWQGKVAVLSTALEVLHELPHPARMWLGHPAQECWPTSASTGLCSAPCFLAGR